MAQTYNNWEAIIVDDGSTDDSVELIKKIIGDDVRFKLYFNSENKGCGFSKRRCVELANGEISGFLDPDDAIIESAIEVMVIKHIEIADVGLIYSNYITCNEKLEPQKVRLQKKVENFQPDFFNRGILISHFATFKNEVYKKTVGIDAYLLRAVDQDLYIKLYEKGKVFYLNENLYHYRVHGGGISTLENVQKARYWHYVAMISAARRRNYNLEDIFVRDMTSPERVKALEYELSTYNKSFIFKVLRKIGLFKIFL